MIVVTEGEKDRLACLQLWSCRFPVVALPFGAEGSGHAFARALEKLSRYDKVVLALDMDGPGREGAIELARMLPPGKAFIAEFPEKDLHDTVQQKGAEVAKRLLFNAAPYRPDGIVDADDLDASLLQPTEWGAKLPYDFLYKWTYGLAPGDVWIIGAGTGIGKSDLAAEIVATHIKPTEDGGSYQRAAVFNYEAGPQSTLRTLLGKLWSKRFNIPDPEDGSPNLYWSRDELLAAMSYRREKCAKVFINDHKGAISWESVKERLRYLKHSEGITLGVVDPVAAMVATSEDERKALDLLFAEAKALAEELAITLIFISHLSRPSEGKSHEEGGRATLRHFRGSGGIVMWASFVIVLERNQQGDEEERKLTTMRMLKDRKTGDSTGSTRTLAYNVLNGRLEEFASTFEKANNQSEDPEAPPL
jgi:twinkle protein